MNENIDKLMLYVALNAEHISPELQKVYADYLSHQSAPKMITTGSFDSIHISPSVPIISGPTDPEFELLNLAMDVAETYGNEVGDGIYSDGGERVMENVFGILRRHEALNERGQYVPRSIGDHDGPEGA